MKSLLLTCLFATATVVYAQCPTPASFVKSKSSKGEGYSVNSQSRSGAIKSGETYEMSFIAQVGMDYRLSSKAADESVGSLSYEIYEMVVEKKEIDGKETFKRTKHVLATSGSAGAEPIEFTTDKTRKVFIAVTLSGGDKKKTHCVGVLVEDKKSTKLGF